MRGPDAEATWTTFVGLWQELRRTSAVPGTVIVVEGERDRAALRGLGIVGPIVLVHQGGPLSALTATLGRVPHRVVVLTDWDGRGGRLARTIAGFLAGGPVELDLEVRRRLARTLKGEVTHVEGLLRWARRMAENEGAPLGHFLEEEPTEGPSG